MIRSTLAVAAAVLALATAPGGAVAGFEDGAAAYQAGDYARAVAEWRPLAEAGDPAAQYNLGILYRQGEGVPADPAQALEWFLRSAAQGNALAMFNLGLIYGSGDGIPADLPAARSWMALAERRTDSDALRRDASYLGGLLARQIGPEADAAALARAESMARDAARGAAAAGTAVPAAAAADRETSPEATVAVAVADAPIRPEPISPPAAEADAEDASVRLAAAPAPDSGLLALRPPTRPSEPPPPPAGIDRLREPRLPVGESRIARPESIRPTQPRLSESHAEPPLERARDLPTAAPTAASAQPTAASDDDPAPERQQEIAVLERVTPGGRGLSPPGAAVARTSPGRGGFGVQVGSLLSEADAAAQWQRLRTAHPELLAGLEPTLSTGVVDGVTRYRLRLGPFDRSAAETFCRRLTDRGGDCYTVPF